MKNGEILEIESNSLVIVGANGSGKSRFGHWIASRKSSKILRITAEKILDPSIRANQGTPNPFDDRSIKRRFTESTTTSPVNSAVDVISSMWMLFSKENKLNRQFRIDMEEYRTNDTKKTEPIIPKLPHEIVKQLFQELLPNLQLNILIDNRSLTIKRSDDSKNYDWTQMSDGEKIILYSIVKCICTERNIIIIDEPETHLHKSILTKLWDKMEALLPENLFIYITHDLDFASTRVNSQKLWIKDYKQGDNWDWELLPNEQNQIPDDLNFQVLGSRQPTLLVEGDVQSIDYQIYRNIYTNHHVVPVGGCDDVIRLTNAFRKSVNHLHYLQIYGLIDRDNRSMEEVDSLNEKGVYTLDVAIVENLLLLIQSKLSKENVINYVNG